jgi:hypothetical protein
VMVSGGGRDPAAATTADSRQHRVRRNAED